MKFTKKVQRGILIAIVHLALVGSLAGKMMYDRMTRPRVWVRTAAYDPYLPIRGRYAAMRLEVQTDMAAEAAMRKQMGYTAGGEYYPARLEVRDGKLFAIADENGSVGYNSPGPIAAAAALPPGTPVMRTATLTEPVDFFIPELAHDPTRVQRGETLWAEVTVPKKGAPRPIQLAVSDGKSWRVLEAK